MNDVAIALAEAGVKIPSVKFRIWTWLRDHPLKPARDIQRALKMPDGTVSAALFKLVKSGHLESVLEPIRPGGRPVAHFCTTAAVYGDTPRAPKTVKIVPPPVVVVHKPSPPKGFDPEALLENCTIKQLREVQRWLSAVFSGCS